MTISTCAATSRRGCRGSASRSRGRRRGSRPLPGRHRCAVPSTMPGTTSGISRKVLTAPLPQKAWRARPSAAGTPSASPIKVAATPTSVLVTKPAQDGVLQSGSRRTSAACSPQAGRSGISCLKKASQRHEDQRHQDEAERGRGPPRRAPGGARSRARVEPAPSLSRLRERGALARVFRGGSGSMTPHPPRRFAGGGKCPAAPTSLPAASIASGGEGTGWGALGQGKNPSSHGLPKLHQFSRFLWKRPSCMITERCSP